MADQTARIILTAKDSTGAAFAKAREGLESIKSGAEKTGLMFGSLGLAISAAFEGISIANAIQTLDSLDDLSEKSGVATERLSELRFAAEVGGSSYEALGKGLRKLAENMAAAAGGSAEAGQTFKTFGINVKNTDGTLKGSDQVLGEIADKFATYKDGAGKAAGATALFGKAGEDLIPLLNQGSAGIQANADEARKLGAVYGGDLAKSAATFNDNLARLKLAGEGAKVALLGDTGLLGALVRISQELIEGRKAFGGYLAAMVQIGIKTAPFASYSEGAKAAREDVNRLTDALEDAQSKVGAKTAPVIGPNGAAFGVAPRQRMNGGASVSSIASDLADARKRLEYFAALEKLEAAAKSPDKGGTKETPTINTQAAAQAAAALKQYQSMLDNIQKSIELDKAALSAGRELTDAERAQIEIEAQLAGTKNTMTDAQKDSVRAKAAEKETLDKTVESMLRYAKLQADDNEQVTANITAIEAQSAARFEDTKALKVQIESIGLNTRELEALKIAQMQATLAAEEGELVKLRALGTDAGSLAAMREKVGLLKDQIRVQSDLNAKTNALEDDPVAGARAALKKYSDEAARAGTLTGEAVTNSLATLESGLTDVLTGKTVDAKQLVDSIIAEFVRLQVVKPLLAGIFGDGKAGGSGGLLGSLVSFGASFFGGARATGGPVEAGVPYTVGERGREMFVPSTSGTIVPNGQMGKGEPAIVQHVTNNIGSNLSRSEVYQAIQQAQAQTKKDILMSMRRGGAFAG